jgi:acetyl-CoA carboxylase biotin carboxylase subunit
VFQKILIANRGEIAVRVVRACRELGISPLAIYSEADSEALHVRLADAGYPCGPAPARDSYLVAERVVEIAKREGADAIHPGYGFLSENADFADRCEAAGIRFIGPTGAVIRAMGDKITARRTMAAAGVAVVPGVTEPISDAEAAACAEGIGYPVLVKASAGGGGKGMRRVNTPAELPQALERVRGESASAFGDATLYLEKFVENPRHIEVQFLADSQGNALHLGERECSIQRRHQKLIEEAPGNGVDAELRAKLGQAALTAAKAVDYCGVGTCEFLVDSAGHFYFLEMNTRIQVEHAITEAITGIDIVVEMIRIAAGEPLQFAQSDVEFKGHAIEARIYAESPERGFIPSPGLIDVYDPPTGPGVRIDTGVEQGTRVTVHYDPLIAKLITWGADREESIARLDRALAEFDIQGIATSISFHRKALHHPDFVSGRYTTDFVEILRRESQRG